MPERGKRSVTQRATGGAGTQEIENEGPAIDLAALGRLQRTATLGQLAAGLAHDLNNILTLILGPVEIARADPQLSAHAKDLLGVASDATRRATAVNQSMLAFVRNEPWRLEVVAVDEVVDDLAPLFKLACGTRIELEIEHRRRGEGAKGTPLTVEIERHQLETALLNLALNARDAMPEGGRLSVTTDLDGDEVRIRVADSGVGMDQETQARAFEPHFSTKGMGHGLGLFMVRRIIESFGGNVALESATGQGTSFTLTLPRTAQPKGTHNGKGGE